jgi:hypothetical protein
VLVDVLTDPDALSMPPKITGEQVKGFALAMSRLVLFGDADEVVNMARSNLRNCPGLEGRRPATGGLRSRVRLLVDCQDARMLELWAGPPPRVPVLRGVRVAAGRRDAPAGGRGTQGRHGPVL